MTKKPLKRFRCPHCRKLISDDLIAGYAARRSSARRTTVTSNPNAGRPRTKAHEPDNPQCRCVDCRRAKGYLPPRKHPRNPSESSE